MFRIIKLTGNSLSPFFLPGDYVLIWTIPGQFRKLIPGDFIVFHHSAYGLLIKRVILNDPVERYIETDGSHPESLTPQKIGRIPYNNVIGKVVHSFHRKR